jgi:hypothetical protein
MVGRGGLEPPTSRLSGVRSNHLSYRPIKVRNPKGYAWWSVFRQRRTAQGTIRATLGGAYRDRTDDPLLAKQVLSQLS